MSSAETTRDTPVSSHLLRIVAGLHAGACRDLADREMILVGSGDDCDIVLADDGVASHHALISLVDGRFQVRALDAPLRLEGRVLHPGDPVELDKVQRVGLGDAALAFGHADDPGWLALMPEGMKFAPPPRNAIPFARRLPMIAAIAVLSLASLAIFAAVMPSQEAPVDVEERLRSLAREYRVAEARIERDVNGIAVLSGTVKDVATRQRMRQQLDSERIDATLTLRTGEDMARDVADVLRGHYPAEKTRYLGNNDVEVTGYFDDMAALEAFAKTRAMRETGVRRVIPINLATPAEGDEADVVEDAVRIVAVERGENAHLVSADGVRYPVGSELPGRGTLLSIGEHVQVLRPDGSLVKLRPEPVQADPDPDDAEAPDPDKAGAAVAQPRSRAYATEQARAARQRM
ncbi:FHA domain-containing protein [Luteimonas sp. R10]|uniref:FHA domain-containing protein n=1 Tax=Luteimonas sp. R10 TaxID=3108176 RepID=UPI003088B3C2|nr:FHA domain-containing protein [Luteimonas sp. R10]